MTTLRHALRQHSIKVSYMEVRAGQVWLWLVDTTKKLDTLQRVGAKHGLRFAEYGNDQQRGPFVRYEIEQVAEAGD